MFLPRNPPAAPESALERNRGQLRLAGRWADTYMYASSPLAEKAIPLQRWNPSATARTFPVFGSNRYTWFGRRGDGRKRFK